MLSDKKDDFDDLFVDDDDEFDTKLVKEVLQKFVTFSQKGEILLRQTFNALDVRRKLLVILLSRKVLAFRKMVEERIGPKEVENLTGLPHSSVTMELPKMVKDRIAKSEKGKYWIPNYALSSVEILFK